MTNALDGGWKDAVKKKHTHTRKKLDVRDLGYKIDDLREPDRVSLGDLRGRCVSRRDWGVKIERAKSSSKKINRHLGIGCAANVANTSQGACIHRHDDIRSRRSCARKGKSLNQRGIHGVRCAKSGIDRNRRPHCAVDRKGEEHSWRLKEIRSASRKQLKHAIARDGARGKGH